MVTATLLFRMGIVMVVGFWVGVVVLVSQVGDVAARRSAALAAAILGTLLVVFHRALARQIALRGETSRLQFVRSFWTEAAHVEAERLYLIAGIGSLAASVVVVCL